MTYPTKKQIDYLNHLAHDLAAGDAWDMFAPMSRSAAHKRATISDASAAIEAALARIARRDRRTGCCEGDVDDGSVLLAGAWHKLSARVLTLYTTHRAEVDVRALAARYAQLVCAGDARPFATALDEQRALIAPDRDDRDEIEIQAS